MSKNKIKQEKAITLIALVVSIIVLLILAGVSIAVLTGENGIINRTTEAKKTNEKSEVIENIRLAYNNAQIGKHSGANEVFEDKMESDLELTYGNGNVTVTKESDKYIIEITGKGTYEILADGTVQKQGAIVSTRNLKIVLSDVGEGENVADNSQEEGTKLYIFFDVNIPSGRLSSISPNLPLEITSNGTYEFLVNYIFDGKSYTTPVSIKVKKYQLRAGMRIGDIVTYTPLKESIIVGAEGTGLSAEQTLESRDDFKVMNINDDGSVDLLGNTYFSEGTDFRMHGRAGYNNGVYLLNKVCSELYSNKEKGITARSVNWEDISSKLTNSGFQKIENYIKEKIGSNTNEGSIQISSKVTNIDKEDQSVTYVRSLSIYPNIYRYESGGKIDGIPIAGKVSRSATFNGYGIDGILTQTDVDENGIQMQSAYQCDSLTVKINCVYNKFDDNDFCFDGIEDGIYNRRGMVRNMFCGDGVRYWIATRCCDCDNDYAYFGLLYGTSQMGGIYFSRQMYSSGWDNCTGDFKIAPVVHIPPDVEMVADKISNYRNEWHVVVD